jgi:hypothetical protein
MTKAADRRIISSAPATEVGCEQRHASHLRQACRALTEVSRLRHAAEQLPDHLTVEDGILTNAAHATRLEAEVHQLPAAVTYVTAKSNSGLLRGRYVMARRLRTPPEKHGHGDLRVDAAALNASKPAGEWQTVDIVLVGNRVTVTLNGTKVHDNAEIQAITGGALDNDELAPGPILIQGDHTKVWFKKITVTPIN